MIRILLIGVLFMAALVGGFLGTLRLLSALEEQPRATTFTVVRLTKPSINGAGWGPQTDAGRVLADTSARLTVPLRGVSNAPLRMTFALVPTGEKPMKARYRVRYNGRRVGVIRPVPGDTFHRESVLIQPSAAYREFPATVELSLLRGDAASAAFRWVAIDNRPEGPSSRGFVDRCTRRMVRGWAADDLGPAEIAVRVDGREVRHRFRRLMRKDLAKVGVPVESGFRVQFRKPVPPGSKISVVAAGGAKLRRSPCTVK